MKEFFPQETPRQRFLRWKQDKTYLRFQSVDGDMAGDGILQGVDDEYYSILTRVTAENGSVQMCPAVIERAQVEGIFELSFPDIEQFKQIMALPVKEQE